MEDREKNSCVVLILKNSRLKVNRKQLVTKSQYFALLLSENYIDRLQQEHVINYDIPISTLQDYINWIHAENFCTKFDFICRTSLEKYCNSNYNYKFYGAKLPEIEPEPVLNSYEDLLKLLHLSVLFSTDQLTEEITIILEAILTVPEFLIDIWLVAMDLGLSTLQDIFFAACLEYFDKLPIDKLIHLESHNLQKLIYNENISSTEDYINDIVYGWIRTNKIRELPFILPILKMKKSKILNCIIDYEKPQNHDSKIFLYCWDGTNFFKHSTLTYPKEITDASQSLIGMQFIGKRYNLYICGGEYGLGRGKFNEKIWRYSLISKKWSVDTHMPVPRRHMITVFFKNKLYLIGGVGRYRKQLNSINIYNVHSRIWTNGPTIPDGFTEIPEYCVNDDKLIIYMTQLHVLIYYSEEDTWTYFKLFNDISLSQKIILMGLDETACFIDVTNKDNKVIRCIKYETDCMKCLKNDITYTCEKRSLLLGPVFKRDSYIIKWCCVDTFLMQCKNSNNIYVWFCQKFPLRNGGTYDNIHMHTFPIQKSIKFDSLFSSFSSTTRKFFHMMDPANLYSQ